MVARCLIFRFNSVVYLEPSVMIRAILICLGFSLITSSQVVAADDVLIPKPEHPRPDARRPYWVNLNGRWQFRFDPSDQGLQQGWERPDAQGYDRTIVVPFPWESELSEIHQVKNAPKVAWYRRHFNVPKNFPLKDHVWLQFGAVDWRADVWINGRKLAVHEGGYTPFEVDISDALKREGDNVVVVRVFDPTDPELPTGKQVGWYTPSSGIWQTVWLEARPATHIAGFHVATTIQRATVRFTVGIAVCDNVKYQLGLGKDQPTVDRTPVTFEPGKPSTEGGAGEKGIAVATLESKIRDPQLWTPEDPYLYEVTLELRDAAGKLIDAVGTYFGLRTIGHGRYGDEPFERILLNGKPLYLRAALDQSFNPRGLYTAPDDDFFKRDLLVAKAMGLNGLRIHIKPEEPRRLYWADKMGVLIMEDMPNTWRQSPRARVAWEETMRKAIVRDRNHPSIVAWVAFNETWGLGKAQDYKQDRDTQTWVGKMVDLIRGLDGHERLVEDNSPCNYDHVVNTDLNSWHFYIDNHEKARQHIQGVVDKTEPGSSFNYCRGLAQSSLPLINSEYGAVSAGGGDRDISWGLRDLTTQLRRHKKIQGFIYTELSDIEWEHNGLVNYDRTQKRFGYDTWVPGMQPADLLGADFVGYDAPPVIVGKPGETIKVPIFVSHYSERQGPATLRYWVSGRDFRADIRTVVTPASVPITWRAYDVVDLEPLKVTLPDYPFVGALSLTLSDEQNRRFAANYVNLVVKPDRPLPRVQARGPRDVTVRFEPGSFASQQWADAAKPPADKVYGHGKGYFEYHISLPATVVKAHPESIYYLFQASSKADRERVDWPQRVNRQDNPQTDVARTWPSSFAVSLNGRTVERINLPDDPADARGVLSHLAGVEHGSHGELVDGKIDLTELDRARLSAGEPLVLRLSIPDDATHAGGLCIFGASTGELPLDPTLQLHTREPLPDDLGVDPNAPVTAPRAPH
jgi:hypothetical protein